MMSYYGFLGGCFDWVKQESICIVFFSNKEIKPASGILKGFCDLCVVVLSNECGFKNYND